MATFLQGIESCCSHLRRLLAWPVPNHIPPNHVTLIPTALLACLPETFGRGELLFPSLYVHGLSLVQWSLMSLYDLMTLYLPGRPCTKAWLPAPGATLAFTAAVPGRYVL